MTCGSSNALFISHSLQPQNQVPKVSHGLSEEVAAMFSLSTPVDSSGQVTIAREESLEELERKMPSKPDMSLFKAVFEDESEEE